MKHLQSPISATTIIKVDLSVVFVRITLQYAAIVLAIIIIAAQIIRIAKTIIVLLSVVVIVVQLKEPIVQMRNESHQNYYYCNKKIQKKNKILMLKAEYHHPLSFNSTNGECFCQVAQVVATAKRMDVSNVVLVIIVNLYHFLSHSMLVVVDFLS